jgi:hypothetical protein
MTTALEGGERSASRPGRSLRPGKTRCPLYRRLDGSQGRSGQVRKTSPPLGFDPQTVQPVASRYTDWATRPGFLLNFSSLIPKQTPALYITLLFFTSEYAFQHYVLIWLHFVKSNSSQRNRKLLFKPSMSSALFILVFTHPLFTCIYNSPVAKC